MQNKQKQERNQSTENFYKEAHLRNVLIFHIFSWYLGALPMFCEIQKPIHANLMQYARSHGGTKVNVMLQKQTRKRIIICSDFVCLFLSIYRQIIFCMLSIQ